METIQFTTATAEVCVKSAHVHLYAPRVYRALDRISGNPNVPSNEYPSFIAIPNKNLRQSA